MHVDMLTLPCEMSMKYAYVMLITHILAKSKKTLQTNIAASGLHYTKLCGSNTV